MLQQGAKVTSAAKYGDTYRMIEEAMPVFGRNLMQAWRLYTKGQTTMSGRPINMPGTPGARKLTSSEAVGKALGFQPLSSTKSYAAYSARKFDDSVRNEKLNDLTVLWLEAMDGKRPAARGEAMRMMREWNTKVSSKGDAHMMITLKDVLRRAKARRRENRPMPGNLREKQRQQDIWGI